MKKLTLQAQLHVVTAKTEILDSSSNLSDQKTQNAQSVEHCKAKLDNRKWLICQKIVCC